EVVAHGEKELASFSGGQKRDWMRGKLTGSNQKLFASLPDYIQDMLLLDRDSHGNLQVSLIPTERLLIDMTAVRVKELDPSVKFSTLNHFFGYEGRCGAPSLFDAAFTLNLGLAAGSLILEGKTGYMASMTGFDRGGEILAIPLTGLINVERRHGKDEMVIEKALVKTSAPAFKYFESRRGDWASSDLFASPGPRQLWGPVAKQLPISVALNQGYPKLEFDF
ncbi:MAG: diphosphate--fructose-6-phosphate 1-phosphotransferase, partial [Spirochaetia bacterium]|nr:diphosphate--fructose-6-phosphate 1-phosphotransferase [Spirochaetia bacterium]